MSDVLSREAIVLGGQARDREAAITEAGQLLVAAGAVDQAYVDAMHERETSVSTFMGNGLAIPHGTNEMKDTILDSALSVVRYDGGVDWAGEQANFVIGIAGRGDEHLEILSQIAILFSDDDDVAKLNAAETPDELFALLSAVNEG